MSSKIECCCNDNVSSFNPGLQAAALECVDCDISTSLRCCSHARCRFDVRQVQNVSKSIARRVRPQCDGRLDESADSVVRYTEVRDLPWGLYLNEGDF